MKYKLTLILAIYMTLISMAFADGNSFTVSNNIDRFSGKTTKQYVLNFDTTQDNGTDTPCNKNCYLIMGDDFIYLNGYALLAVEQSNVKQTRVRLRLGNNIYSGVCNYSNDGKGCYISFNSSALFGEAITQKIIKQLLSFKGYLALEVTQEFNTKEAPTSVHIWYKNL